LHLQNKQVVLLALRSNSIKTRIETSEKVLHQYS
jgi:hypothetical protein